MRPIKLYINWTFTEWYSFGFSCNAYIYIVVGQESGPNKKYISIYSGGSGIRTQQEIYKLSWTSAFWHYGLMVEQWLPTQTGPCSTFKPQLLRLLLFAGLHSVYITCRCMHLEMLRYINLTTSLSNQSGLQTGSRTLGFADGLLIIWPSS